jgi:hypothetical protein
MIISTILSASAYSQDDTTYYFRTSAFHPYREFKFKRLDNEIKYVANISLPEMMESIKSDNVFRLDTSRIRYSFTTANSKGDIDTYELEYYLLTSREDAELYALDIIGNSTSIYRHVSDYDIDLGDDAWIDGNEQTVLIRNNICIFLRGRIVHEAGGCVLCAQAIDAYIRHLKMYDTADYLIVPSIDNIEVISLTERTYQVDGEERTSYRYKLSVVAHDASSDTLYYRTSQNSLASETDGTIAISKLSKEINCKVFVMNERHLVASKDIFN